MGGECKAMPKAAKFKRITLVLWRLKKCVLVRALASESSICRPITCTLGKAAINPQVDHKFALEIESHFPTLSFWKVWRRDDARNASYRFSSHGVPAAPLVYNRSSVSHRHLLSCSFCPCIAWCHTVDEIQLKPRADTCSHDLFLRPIGFCLFFFSFANTECQWWWWWLVVV